MADIDQEGFPLQLLNEPPEKRYEYYKKHTVAHPIIQKAFDTVWEIIHEPAGKQIVLVLGPPRAGKTFLLEWLESEIKYEWAQKQASDLGRIPIVSIEVPARDVLKPSWALIYERILRALEEPLIDKKVIYGDVLLRPSSNGKFSIDNRVTGGKLRIALEEALKHRLPFAVFFDEFHHLLGMAGLSWQDQMDCVKSLANMTRTLLVLSGTYEGLDLIDLSDQLTLRTKVVHLRRYGDGEIDMADFESTINSFQVYMPFRKEPDLTKHFDYLYERSVGLVGNLANWLLQATCTALKEGAPTLTLRHLKKHVPLSEKQALKMRTNIMEDETGFLDIVGIEDIISDMDDEIDGAQNGKPDEARALEPSSSEPPTAKPIRKRRRVGERVPERDPIGREHCAA
jgi:hypothetical protein